MSLSRTGGRRRGVRYQEGAVFPGDGDRRGLRVLPRAGRKNPGVFLSDPVTPAGRYPLH